MRAPYNTNKYVLEGRVKDALSVDQGYPKGMADHVLVILEGVRQGVQEDLDRTRKAAELAESKAAAFRLLVDGVTGSLATLRTDTALLASLARSKGAPDPIGLVQAAAHAAMCPDGEIHSGHNHFVAGGGVAHCPGVSELVCGLDSYHGEHFWGYPFDTQHRCPGHIRPVPPDARCPLAGRHPVHLWVPAPGQENHCCSGA